MVQNYNPEFDERKYWAYGCQCLILGKKAIQHFSPWKSDKDLRKNRIVRNRTLGCYMEKQFDKYDYDYV